MIKQTFLSHEFQVVKGTTHPEYSIFTFESEERDFRDKYWQIKDRDIVFDVGCSYGTYALSACSAGATVYAFEPEPTVFKDTVVNVGVNGWENKCFVYNFGLWSSEETSIDMKGYAPHWPAQTITENYKMKTLDQIVAEKNLSKIDWIKIDTEGAEEQVVNGGKNSIKKFQPRLIIECHTFLDEKIKDRVIAQIKNCGNYIIEEVSRPPCVMLVCYPQP